MKHTIKYNGSVITLRFIRKCKWGNLIEGELTPSKEQKRHFKLGIPTSGEAIRLDTLMCDTRRVKELVQTLTAIDSGWLPCNGQAVSAKELVQTLTAIDR